MKFLTPADGPGLQPGPAALFESLEVVLDQWIRADLWRVALVAEVPAAGQRRHHLSVPVQVMTVTDPGRILRLEGLFAVTVHAGVDL